MPEYRVIADYPAYRVGDDGSVWSCYSSRGNPGCKLTDKWRELRLTETNGYMVVNLCHRSKRKMQRVHQLVAKAFLGDRPADMDICHNNGNSTDNRLENLRYDTRKANVADQRKHGTLVRGERHGSNKLTEQQVLAIRSAYSSGKTSLRKLAKEFGVSFRCISLIVNRKQWSWLV